ncbi:IVa2 [Murine mastadenovirus A]|uniref:IVa2 n=1 Tax=Murine mastadenovirus A TaxID=129956 RepID=UPI00001D96C3|nr:IVa2 [Murine mastadenovirus A]
MESRESKENLGEHEQARIGFHRNGDSADSLSSPVAEPNFSSPGGRSSNSILHCPPQSPEQGNNLDCLVGEELQFLWPRLQCLQHTLSNLPLSEGLKPLMNFETVEDLAALAGKGLLQELKHDYEILCKSLNSAAPLLSPEGNCESLNYSLQPLIAIVYGPTGSGKSQLLRNLLSCHLIDPSPETVFFVVPQIDMIPPQEMSAWNAQLVEGNYTCGPQQTIVPKSGTLKPRLITLTYDDLTADHNYDVTHPQNIFAQAAQRGPICIIVDECMEELGKHKSIAKFFHAFPSKLHDRFPQCTGYSVFVVLHNMNPRKDQAGNIATLKIQSKCHIISPKMQPSQVARFINTYTKAMPTAITLLLKDIFHHNANHINYDWIIYNTSPEHECMQWMYLHPQNGLMPMYLNVQTILYQLLEKIDKVLRQRQRWNTAYSKKCDKLANK